MNRAPYCTKGMKFMFYIQKFIHALLCIVSDKIAQLRQLLTVADLAMCDYGKNRLHKLD